MRDEFQDRPALGRLSSLLAQGLALLAGCTGLVLASACPASAQTPFYTASTQELPGRPGTVIRQEPIIGTPLGASAWRMLYRSTGLNGEPIAVSGIVVVPDGPAPEGGRPIVAWAHPTTGVVSRCAPSLALNFFKRVQGLEAMLAQGYAVVATDYAGLGTTGPHPYLVGVSAGRSVLDSVRAAGSLPGVGGTKRFIVWGHSEGGHAALYTGILARSYAPDLQLLGVAAAAPATDLATLLRDDFNTVGGKNLTSMALWSWSRVFGVPIDKVVEPEAIPTVDRLAGECLESIVDVLILRATEKPLQRDFLTVPDITTVPPWKAIIAQNTPGPLPRSVPVFMAQGTADQTVRSQVTAAYVRRLCRHGSAVQSVVLPGVIHAFIARDSANAAVGWMAGLFAGRKPPSNCGQTG